MFEQEIAFYAANHENLRKNYLGKNLVIVKFDSSFFYDIAT
jgi:hypothetical protein